MLKVRIAKLLMTLGAFGLISCGEGEVFGPKKSEKRSAETGTVGDPKPGLVSTDVDRRVFGVWNMKSSGGYTEGGDVVDTVAELTLKEGFFATAMGQADVICVAEVPAEYTSTTIELLAGKKVSRNERINGGTVSCNVSIKQGAIVNYELIDSNNLEVSLPDSGKSTTFTRK